MNHRFGCPKNMNDCSVIKHEKMDNFPCVDHLPINSPAFMGICKIQACKPRLMIVKWNGQGANFAMAIWWLSNGLPIPMDNGVRPSLLKKTFKKVIYFNMYKL